MILWQINLYNKRIFTAIIKILVFFQRQVQMLKIEFRAIVNITSF